ncbi:hypothetical protein ACLX1H_011048 [Fusarium chlamydosporum]
MASSSMPATATVVDFICLFTHDLKRKQKRWQDGVLKYHTFNKRVMVYDDRNHFIGDAHWQGGGDLEPGDEFELDRGSAIVQVSDRTGQREQDLTELLDKRAKEVEKRRSNAGTRTPGSTAVIAHTPKSDQNPPHFQLRHRPLNDLVGGAPRIGRAIISPHSPYEVRKMTESPAQQQDSPTEDARPSKRRRQEESPPSKMGHARALFGTTLTLTPFSSSIPAARSQALLEKTTTKPRNSLISTRADLLGSTKRTDARSTPTHSHPNTDESEPCASHQPPPRRVFTQRASLKDLLAGNEQNRHEDRPRPREPMPREHPHVSKRARPNPSHTRDNNVSVLAREAEQVECHKQALQNSPCPAGTRKKPAEDGSSMPCPPALANVEPEEPDESRKQPAETDDDAFLNWLARDENSLSDHHTTISITNSHLPLSNLPGSTKSTKDLKTVEKKGQNAAQAPIHVSEEEQDRPKRQVAQIRPQVTAPRSIRKHGAVTSKPQGIKRPLSTDKASTEQAEAVKSTPAKEPRTELRIRSRQRRGLLMVAQNKQSNRAESLGRSLPSSSTTGSDVNNAARPIIPSVLSPEKPEIADANVKRIDPPPQTVKGKEPAVLVDSPSSFQDSYTEPLNNFDSAATEDVSSAESNKDPKPLQVSEDASPLNEVGISTHVVSEEDRASVAPSRRTNPSRRTRAKPVQVVLSDDEQEITAAKPPSMADDSDSQAEDSSTDAEPARKHKSKSEPKSKPEASSGPRITKMSRKSVKSKEIFGFTMPTEDLPPAGFGVVESGQPKAAASERINKTAEIASYGDQAALKSLNNDTLVRHQEAPARELPSENQLQKKQSKTDQPEVEQPPQQLQTKQPPRIPNPATRGKKAARKQDAAGLPPQALVQSEASASSHIASVNPTHKPNFTSHTPQSELPGFCKANGGAWSRHAEDLLGMTRPSKAPPRQ